MCSISSQTAVRVDTILTDIHAAKCCSFRSIKSENKFFNLKEEHSLCKLQTDYKIAQCPCFGICKQ